MAKKKREGGWQLIVRKAEARINEGDFEAAEELLRPLVSSPPREGLPLNVLLDLALAVNQQGSALEAIALVELAKKLSKNPTEVARAWAYILQEWDRDEEADAFLAAEVRRNPENPWLKSDWYQVLLFADKDAQAESLVDDLIGYEPAPEEAMAWARELYQRGRNARDILGQHDLAERFFTRAEQLDGSHGENRPPEMRQQVSPILDALAQSLGMDPEEMREAMQAESGDPEAETPA